MPSSDPTAAPTDSPVLSVTAELVADLVRLGGYTHRLFTGASGEPVPLPGQAVLLLMGGLVEQSGVLDHAIALVELRRVRFHRMLTAGDTLQVSIEEVESSATSRGRRIAVYRWTGRDQGSEVVTAEAVMLVPDGAPVEGAEA